MASPDRPLPTLDTQALERLRELDPDGRHGVLGRVLTAFESSLQRMLVQLRTEGAATDSKLVATLAHTMKSSSASVGALELARACADVEARRRAGAADGLDRDIDLLIAHAETALLAVGAILRP
jgi:HPt (histidine-containing phosphotransfer) domain-containing protein